MNLQDLIQDMVNEIQNTLGHGHSKEIYQSALSIALHDESIPHETHKVLPITFRNRFAGTLVADIVVDQRMVIVFGDMDACKMYKRISQLPFGLMIAFTQYGPTIEPC
jgi:GxxExxY protein